MRPINPPRLNFRSTYSCLPSSTMSVLPRPAERRTPATGVVSCQPRARNKSSDTWSKMSESYTMAPRRVFLTISVKPCSQSAYPACPVNHHPKISAFFVCRQSAIPAMYSPSYAASRTPGPTQRSPGLSAESRRCCLAISRISSLSFSTNPQAFQNTRDCAKS